MFGILPGAYELDELNKAIDRNQSLNYSENHYRWREFYINLRANNNTLTCDLFSVYDVEITPENSTATLLGFEPKVIEDVNRLFQ